MYLGKAALDEKYQSIAKPFHSKVRIKKKKKMKLTIMLHYIFDAETSLVVSLKCNWVKYCTSLTVIASCIKG